MELNFDDFKRMAKNSSLSKWEKIGFPDEYRKETESYIFDDIAEKLQLKNPNTTNILDIGCGCSGLVDLIINYSLENDKYLFLVDSEEMLLNIDLSPRDTDSRIKLIPGYFPHVEELNKSYTGRFDAILVYSVLQYPFLEGNIYQFIHRCVDLLAEGGRLLIGDIPNFSKRDRFLASKEGQVFASKNVEVSSNVLVDHEKYERIDDSIIFSIMQRFRNFNCETYLVEQSINLPFSNRREDVLIVKR